MAAHYSSEMGVIGEPGLGCNSCQRQSLFHQHERGTQAQGVPVLDEGGAGDFAEGSAEVVWGYMLTLRECVEVQVGFDDHGGAGGCDQLLMCCNGRGTSQALLLLSGRGSLQGREKVPSPMDCCWGISSTCRLDEQPAVDV